VDERDDMLERARDLELRAARKERMSVQEWVSASTASGLRRDARMFREEAAGLRRRAEKEVKP